MLFAVLLAAVTFSPSLSAADAAFAVPAWLPGRWVGLAPGAEGMEEIWTDVRGGVTFGINRTVRDGELVAFEFLILEPTGDGSLRYRPYPGAKAAASFLAMAVDERTLLLENRDNAFPRAIRYERSAPDALTITLEGADGRRVVLPFERR